MSQNFQTFTDEEFISLSYVKIINNFLANRSLNSGTTFPSTLLENGVPCWRTDSNELYIYQNEAWAEVNAKNAKELAGVPAAGYLRGTTDSAHTTGSLTKELDTSNNIEDSIGAVNNFRVFQPSEGGDAFMSFRLQTNYGVHFGLNLTNQKLSIGGWSLGSNAYAIYHEGNKPTPAEIGALASGATAAAASKLATPRNITLDGDVQGSASFDGSANITITANFATSQIPAGTKMLFQQTAAPTGWTKDTTHNNKALRVVTGGAGSGGSVGFTGIFGQRTILGSVGATTLTTSQMPAHSHVVTSVVAAGNYAMISDGKYPNIGLPANRGTTSAGSGGSHTHSGSGLTLNMDVAYVDLIIATKN